MARRPLPERFQRELPALAIPVFGYENHVTIEMASGCIRRFAVVDTTCHDGSLPQKLVTSEDLAAGA